MWLPSILAATALIGVGIPFTGPERTDRPWCPIMVTEHGAVNLAHLLGEQASKDSDTNCENKRAECGQRLNGLVIAAGPGPDPEEEGRIIVFGGLVELGAAIFLIVITIGAIKKYESDRGENKEP